MHSSEVRFFGTALALAASPVKEPALDHDQGLGDWLKVPSESLNSFFGTSLGWSHINEKNLVLLMVDHLAEFCHELQSIGCAEFTTENRELDMLSVAIKQFEDLAQSLRITDVVADDVCVPHASPGPEGRVFRKFALQATPKNPGLHFQHPAITGLVAEYGVPDELVQAPLVGFDECLASPFFQRNPRGSSQEIVLPYESSIEGCDHRAIADDGAEFFHEVEGKTWLSWLGLMQKAEIGVESDAREHNDALFGEEAVGEG
jgi:hypothetical protein